MRQYETKEEKLEKLEREVENWKETAAHFSRSAEYYKGLLDKCAPFLGKGVYICDDKSVVDEPLRAKIPELVERMYRLLLLVEDAIYYEDFDLAEDIDSFLKGE